MGVADWAWRAGRQTARVGFASREYGEIMDFLVDEAALLDRDDEVEWLACLTPDVQYSLRRRQNLHPGDGDGVGAEGTADYASLERMIQFNKAARMTPLRGAPRVRRLVTNVRAFTTDVQLEYAVESSILLLRYPPDDPSHDAVSAQRTDVLRQTEQGLRLARRDVLFDAVILDAPYPNVIF